MLNCEQLPKFFDIAENGNFAVFPRPFTNKSRINEWRGAHLSIRELSVMVLGSQYPFLSWRGFRFGIAALYAFGGFLNPGFQVRGRGDQKVPDQTCDIWKAGIRVARVNSVVLPKQCGGEDQ